MNDTTVEVAIVGSGRLAAALAASLGAGPGGFRLVAIHARRPDAARAVAERFGARAVEAHGLAVAGVVFVAVSDDAVAGVAAALAREVPGRSDRLWLHGAGSLGVEVLAPLRGRRAVLHPFASLPGGGTLAGHVLACSGEPDARDPTLALAAALGGRPVWIDDIDRAAYHAAATLLANGTTALAAAGTSLLERATAGALGREAALALIHSALRPLAGVSPDAALTGPVRRGDAAVIRAHRAALREDPSLLRLYDALMLQALALARRAGLDAEKAGNIEEALDP